MLDSPEITEIVMDLLSWQLRIEKKTGKNE